MLKSIRNITLILTTLVLLGFVPNKVEVPSPQSLMVTLTGFRDAENQLKCKLFYMTTLPADPSFISSIHIQCDKPSEAGKMSSVADIVVPFDHTKAKTVDGVISFYTTRNILYVGIGEYDLLRNYECKISFLDEQGNESKAAVFKK